MRCLPTFKPQAQVLGFGADVRPRLGKAMTYRLPKLGHPGWSWLIAMTGVPA